MTDPCWTLKVKVALCHALQDVTGVPFAWTPMARVAGFLLARMVARGPDRRGA